MLCCDCTCVAEMQYTNTMLPASCLLLAAALPVGQVTLDDKSATGTTTKMTDWTLPYLTLPDPGLQTLTFDLYYQPVTFFPLTIITALTFLDHHHRPGSILAGWHGEGGLAPAVVVARQ